MNEPPLKKRKAYRNSAMNNNNENYKIKQLFNWLLKNKGFIDLKSIEISHTQQLGYHLRAIRDLDPGITILSVPSNLMITWKTIVNTDIRKNIYNNNNEVDNDDNFSFYNQLYKIEMDHLSTLTGDELLNVHSEKTLSERLKLLDRYISGKTGRVAPKLLSDHGLLIAYIISSRFTNKTFHGEYAKSLPDQYNTPLTWNKKDLSLLGKCVLGHKLLQSVTAHMTILLYDYNILRNCDKDLFTLENIIWASASIRSRNFVANEKMIGESNNNKKSMKTIVHEQNVGVMVPVLDLINHDPGTVNITWTMKNQGISSSSAASSNMIPIPSAVLYHPIKKGEQVMSHYGTDKSNFDLIELHGFAQFDGACDVVGLHWSINDLPNCANKEWLEKNATQLQVFLNDIYSYDLKTNFNNGSSIEFELSHDMPIPKYLASIANAIGIDQKNEDLNITATPRILAIKYLFDYLTEKLKSLFIHLENNVGKHFNYTIWKYDDQTNSVTNKLQQLEHASLQWERLIAINLQGNVVTFKASDKKNNASIEEGFDNLATTYAISSEAQILAYFDSQVNIIHHAIEMVRNGEI